MDRLFAFRADQPGFAAVALDSETTVRAHHHPLCRAEGQIMTAHGCTPDFPRLLPPGGIMAMTRANQSMGNFMQDRICNMVNRRLARIMP